MPLTLRRWWASAVGTWPRIAIYWREGANCSAKRCVSAASTMKIYAAVCPISPSRMIASAPETMDATMFNEFSRRSKATKIAGRLEAFISMLNAAAEISAASGHGDARRMFENTLAFYAAVWAAADAYGQLLRASPQETAEAVRLHIGRVADAAETFELMQTAFSLPELAPVVQATGFAIFTSSSAPAGGTVSHRLIPLAELIANFKGRPRLSS
ncbi:hypothetical protein [Bosea sp. BIWAKO-01]|uniref:hypothetical protein n=1 Tax=Bosea sp. BIWAKO-01 TaxID=506668 RepID=UPI00114CB5A3|nr:hypothetical protein [Bosea sp. BIWAKO-01]